MVSIFASKPSCPGFDFQRTRNILRGKIVKVADVNQRRWLEESGQWLENDDQTHLVQASASTKKELSEKCFNHQPGTGLF